MAKKERIYRAGKNIFADIGSSYPERTLVRAQIMSRMVEIINERGLTQKETGALLGIPQSKISCLMNGKLSVFSLDHLLALLNKLGRDVDIVIKPKQEKTASTHVLVAA